MDLTYTFDKKSFSSSFNYTEDDREKTYYVDLTDPAHKNILGAQAKIVFVKPKNDYAQAQGSPDAKSLLSSIAAAIEQLEKNKG